MKNRGVLQWAVLVLSVLFCIGVQTVFKACGPKEDGTWMHCHEVQRYLFLTGIALAALSVLGLVIRNRTAAILISLCTIACAVLAVLLPGTLMQMCMMNTMRCHAVMKPFARIMGILIAVLSLVDIIKLLRAK